MEEQTFRASHSYCVFATVSSEVRVLAGEPSIAPNLTPARQAADFRVGVKAIQRFWIWAQSDSKPFSMSSL